MHWKKLGQVFEPDGTIPWMTTHAAMPFAEHIEGDIFRVYFSSRDEGNRSYTGSLLLDLNNPKQILHLDTEPLLSPGNLGAFDDSGALASWVVSTAENALMYYVGFNLGVTVPFRNAVGVARRNSNGRWERLFEGPIVDRTMHEPHFCASCCVLPGEDFWRMWYLSCTGWRMRKGKPEHRYHIKYAESSDGINWRRDGFVSIDFANDHEYAISRPSVIRDNHRWRMWYSFRGQSYRIGYAESEDGRQWERLDGQVGIDVSKTGWDSEMIEYPFVFENKGQRYMLYNGNGYGKTRFGLAVFE
ncbi:MAG: hypothetical protein H7240_00400 [Glaciimonas sp.]|nr:hypothetical protein [Glaciimonas sp.]